MHFSQLQYIQKPIVMDNTLGAPKYAESGFGKHRIFSWMLVADDSSSFSESSSIKKKYLTVHATSGYWCTFANYLWKPIVLSNTVGMQKSAESGFGKPRIFSWMQNLHIVAISPLSPLLLKLAVK